MRSLLVVPLSPDEPGSGLAIRAGLWRDALRSLGDVDVIVVPIAGSPLPSDVNVAPLDRFRREPACARLRAALEWPAGLPRLAAQLGPDVGYRWAIEHAAVAAPAEVVVSFRGYVAPFALGVLQAIGWRPLVVDLDDDDIAVAEQSGDHREATAVRVMLAELRRRGATVTAAQAGPGRILVQNSIPPPSCAAPVVSPTPTLVYVGNFRYGPNVEGARWLLSEVWPLLRQRCRLLLVGPGSLVLADDCPPGVQPMGLVDDLAPLYACASAALVPLLHGSGTRIKIIDAWAHGVPVVTTPIGGSGLPLEHDREALVAEQPAAFAAAIDALLSDASLAGRLRAAGSRLYERHYAWPVATAAAAEVVAQTVAAALPPAEPRSPSSIVAEVAKGPAQRNGLDITEVDDGLVIYDATGNRVHHLNPVATLLFEMCDGARSIDEIVAATSSLGGEVDEAAARAALQTMIGEGLLTNAAR